MSKREYSVLILGLDGATFDLMLPWIDEGHLPCLGRLLKEGASSRLRSTIPPITPCAWSSFMTGKNPGKHGLFDFVEPLPNSRGFRFTNASSRHGETLWGHLSRKQRRVGVMNVPMTYPPEPVNGYLISGLDTPHEHSPYMYPDAIRQELRGQSIQYRIELQHLGNMRNDARRDRNLADMREIESIRTKALKYLSQKHPADFRMLVYGATDQVAHHFWHYMDEHHDKHDPQGALRYRHAIRDIYKHVDQCIASVLEDEDGETVVMIMSDHGFGPTTDVRLRLNQIMEHHRLLSFVPERQAGRLQRTVAGISRPGAAIYLVFRREAHAGGPVPQAARLVRRTGRGQDRLEPDDGLYERGLSLQPGDLDQSPRPPPGCAGAVRPRVGAGVERGRTNPGRSKGSGDGPPGGEQHLPHARPVSRPLCQKRPRPAAFLVGRRLPAGAEHSRRARATAGRTLDGADQGWRGIRGFASVGRRVHDGGGPTRRGLRFSGADITDIAPTVLYLMGLPVPSDMDGRPLVEALDPEFVAQNPPQYESADESLAASGGHQSFTEEEEALIAKRLQSLGYIE